MQIRCDNPLVEVKRLIETLDGSHSYMIFLDREGEIDCVSEQADNDDAWVCLHEEARARSGGAYFEITSFSPNRGLYTSDGRSILPDDDEALLNAVAHAAEERSSFYREKEAEFGPGAWPQSA